MAMDTSKVGIYCQVNAFNWQGSVVISDASGQSSQAFISGQKIFTAK
jgi:hypothetical protein